MQLRDNSEAIRQQIEECEISGDLGNIDQLLEDQQANEKQLRAQNIERQHAKERQ